MARPPAQCSLCLLGKELTMCQREDIRLNWWKYEGYEYV